MDKASKVVIVTVMVLIAAAGIAIAFSNNDGGDDTSKPASTANSQTNETAATDENQAEPTATVTYAEDGFTIDKSTIKAGDTVRVVNNSDRALDFSSGPHPVHYEQQELNLGLIEPGSSKTFVMTEPGTWNYHNHEHDSHSGTITVE